MLQSTCVGSSLSSITVLLLEIRLSGTLHLFHQIGPDDPLLQSTAPPTSCKTYCTHRNGALPLQAYFDMLVTTRFNALFHINPGAAVFRHDGNADDAPEYLDSVLALLSRTSTSGTSPGLQGIHLHQNLGYREVLASPTTAALLSQALLHHTALTSLSLEGLVARSSGEDTPAAATILLALPRLKHLTYLSLSFLHMHPANVPKPVPASQSTALLDLLTAAIAALPHLASFSLTPFLVDGQPHMDSPSDAAARGDAGPAQKRRRLASAAPAVSLDPLVDALSAAPSLTRLRLICKGAAQIPCSGLRGPFKSLRHLDLSLLHSPAATAEDICMRPSLLLPTAPLPIHNLSLQLTDMSDGGGPAAFDTALEAFPGHAQLTRVHLRLRAAYDASLRCLGVGLRHLAHVPSVSLAVEMESLQDDISWHSLQAIAAGLRGMAALSALDLKLPAQTSGVPNEAAPDAMHAYADGCMYGSSANTCATAGAQTGSAICAESALVDLKLTFDGITPGKGMERCAIPQFPVSSFTCLTSLILRFERRAFQAKYMVAQLPQLTSLVRLHVASLHCDNLEDVERCLAPLTQLTEVALRVMPVGPALVRCVARCAARMPSLASMRLTSCDGPRVNLEQATNCNFAAADWFEGLLELPPHGEYNWQCDNVNSCEVRFAAVMQELADRGARVSSTFLGHEVKFSHGRVVGRPAGAVPSPEATAE